MSTCSIGAISSSERRPAKSTSPQRFLRALRPAAHRQPACVDALRSGGIHYGLHGGDKPAVLRAIVDTLSLPPNVDRGSVSQLLLAREALGSTAIGEGIAIPHVRRPILVSGSCTAISLCFLDQPIDFAAPDDKPVFAIFLLITPTARTHLQCSPVFRSHCMIHA